MKHTLETIKSFAHEVMDKRQIADFNAWAGTNYDSKDELIGEESEERLLRFFEI